MERAGGGLSEAFDTQFFRDVPSSPGVYFMFGAGRELLYIGKAANLRKRLSSYALLDGGPDLRKLNLVSRVTEILWQKTKSEEEALVREADLIQALRPPSNAAYAWDDPYTYIHVSKVSKGAADGVRFEVLPIAGNTKRSVYGSFPHLGKGKYSFPAVKMKAGYPALLRLILAAQADSHRTQLPSRISGKSFPISFEMKMKDELRKPLNELMSGRSAGLLRTVAHRIRSNPHIPEVMRMSTQTDLSLARDFYLLGPRALRRFRQRHGLPPQPVAQQTIDALIRTDLQDQLGDFRITR